MPERGWRSKVGALLKKIAMMLFTVMVPEAVLLKAIGDFTSAAALTKLFQATADADGSRWSQVHAFFTNMGGFVIQFTPETPSGNSIMHVEPTASTVSIIAPSNDINATPVTEQHIEIATSTDTTATPVIEQRIETATSTASSDMPITTVAQPPIEMVTMHPNQDLDVERGDSPTKGIPAVGPTSPKFAKAPPAKKTGATPRDRKLLKAIKYILAQVPETPGSNAVIVEEILSDIHSKLVAGESTGFQSFDQGDTAVNLARLRGYDWALDGPQLILAREMGIIDQIPNVSKDEIEDKSNSDALVKFIAVAQVTWQIIQLIMRWVKGLPSSQIEVATVGFSLCAFIMYLAYWSKPQDVATPYTVQAKRYPTKDEILQLAQKGPSLDGFYTNINYTIPEHAIHLDLTATEEKQLDGGIIGWSGVTLGGVLFGLMHCTAWNFYFPTPVERLLWRIASVITAALPIFHYVRALCWIGLARLEKTSKKRFINSDTLSASSRGVRFFGLIGIVLYFSSRVYLVVETFRSLLYLLPDTFQTTT